MVLLGALITIDKLTHSLFQEESNAFVAEGMGLISRIRVFVID
jgi:hypothetical protein